MYLADWRPLCCCCCCCFCCCCLPATVLAFRLLALFAACLLSLLIANVFVSIFGRDERKNITKSDASCCCCSFCCCCRCSCYSCCCCCCYSCYCCCCYCSFTRQRQQKQQQLVCCVCLILFLVILLFVLLAFYSLSPSLPLSLSFHCFVTLPHQQNRVAETCYNLLLYFLYLFIACEFIIRWQVQPTLCNSILSGQLKCLSQILEI